MNLKRNITKKIWSHLLVATMTISLTSNLGMAEKVQAATILKSPRTVSDSTMNSEQVVTWDCVWFGSYPQSEVISSEDVYASLEKATDWDDNGDITIDGVKYRRLLKQDATYTSDGAAYYHWADDTTYHYFRYEPIKWRVLQIDDNRALLLSDIVLDNQRYHSVETDVTWEKSTIRSWLNGFGSDANLAGIDYDSDNFMDSAFNSEEGQAILETNVENANNGVYNTSGGNSTTDKIFLLSESEVCGTDTAQAYGFVNDRTVHDEARNCLSSDYAKAMGIYTNNNQNYIGNSEWWLRTPGNQASYAASVYFDATVLSYGEKVNRNESSGVRAVLNLDLSSADDCSYAGIVKSNQKEGIVHSGDLNEDEKVTAIDALIALQISVSDNFGTQEQRENADVDYDDVVTSKDVLIILKHAAGVTTSLYE